MAQPANCSRNLIFPTLQLKLTLTFKANTSGQPTQKVLRENISQKTRKIRLLRTEEYCFVEDNSH